MSYLHRADTIRDLAMWSFETERFFVAFIPEDEDMDPADSFVDGNDIAFARQGGSHWFCAYVGVYLKGRDGWEEIGSDYLGGCSYRSFEEFYTAWRTSPDEYRNTLANRDKGVAVCHYFPDMVRAAIHEARSTLDRRGSKRQ